MGDWKEYKIGEIANLFQGLAINAQSKHMMTEDNTELPLLRIKDLQEGTETFFIEADKVPIKCIAGENDLIFTRTGIVGLVFMGKKGVVHNNSFRIVPKSDKVYLPYLFNYFNRAKIRDYLTNIAAGSVQPDMNHSIFKAVEVLLPPIPEQKAISKLLSSFNDKIDLLHRQNATLEGLAEVLFREWFVEGAGDDWEEGTLEDLIEVKYGKDHKKLEDGDIPVYGSGGIMRYAERALYEKESVLIPRKGSLNNVVYINEPFWTVDTMFFTIMKKENLAKFIYFFVNAINLSMMNVGSAVPSMTTKVLNSLPLSLPPDEVLERFEKMVNPFFTKMNKNKLQIQTLENLRDTLLPKLMSGEVRVKY